MFFHAIYSVSTYKSVYGFILQESIIEEMRAEEPKKLSLPYATRKVCYYHYFSEYATIVFQLSFKMSRSGTARKVPGSIPARGRLFLIGLWYVLHLSWPLQIMEVSCVYFPSALREQRSTSASFTGIGAVWWGKWKTGALYQM